MPTITHVEVVIYDSRIQAHFTPAGEVGKNAGSVGRAAEVLARGFVNRRSGELQASIRAGHQPGGRLYYNLFLNANARHAQWVEHGTGDLAMAPGDYRRLKPYPEGGFPTHVNVNGPRVLRGQKGQHYLARGMAGALRAHGYPADSVVLARGQAVRNRL